ncbi:MAG: hypothetical protein A4E72_00172 [Syntrophus sp. PtaU1.Bin208]|nr:MAG: hypothetical protein A4E72_00172 [Syntrophus sp. PtaU1.Bin208]
MGAWHHASQSQIGPQSPVIKETLAVFYRSQPDFVTPRPPLVSVFGGDPASALQVSSQQRLAQGDEKIFPDPLRIIAHLLVDFQYAILGIIISQDIVPLLAPCPPGCGNDPRGMEVFQMFDADVAVLPDHLLHGVPENFRGELFFSQHQSHLLIV